MCPSYIIFNSKVILNYLPIVLAYEPLRVSLSDMLSADKKGKWWLVGAGWSGNPLVELEQQREKAKSSEKTGKSGNKEEDKDSEAALLELARKQGMNTDVRRGVFVVLMTSEVSEIILFMSHRKTY